MYCPNEQFILYMVNVTCDGIIRSRQGSSGDIFITLSNQKLKNLFITIYKRDWSHISYIA